MLPLQSAKYLGKAVAVSWGGTDAKPQLAVTFEIVDHAEYAGLTHTWFGYFTEATSERSIESLQHMGWKGDDLSELAELDADACARILPDVVQLACEPDTYNGETRLKIRWVNPANAGKFKFKEPLAGNALKAFAAQMKGTIRGMQATSGNSKPKQSPHPNAPGNTDDIPF